MMALIAALAEPARQAAEATDPMASLGIAVVLLVLAVALTVLEVFLVSGGVLGIGAVVAAAFAIHNAFLFDDTTGWVFLLGTPAVGLAVVRWGLRRLGRSSLVVKGEIGSHVGYRERSSAQGLGIGSRGVLLTKAMPCGRARFGDHTLDVEIQAGSGEQGDSIEIIDLQGPRVLVIINHTPDR